MSFMAAPYTVAGLYWHDQAERESFGHVCAYLMQRGMTTLEYGTDADPNAALLTALHTPNSMITEAKFLTSAQLPPREQQTRRPPGRIIVSYDYISAEAATHGDHRAIDIMWSEAAWGPVQVLPKRQAQHLPLSKRRDDQFFIDLCTQLDPLYANYGFEGDGLARCLYDAISGQSKNGQLSTQLRYLRNDLLTQEEHALFFRCAAAVKKLPNGTFFSNRYTGSPPKQSLPDVLTPALRRFRRAHL